MISKDNLDPITEKGGEIYVMISSQNCRFSNMIMGIVVLDVGQKIATHVHDYSDENFIVTKGQGKITIDAKVLDLRVNHAYHISRGKRHSVFNDGDEKLELIFASSPLAPKMTDGDRKV